MFDALFFDLDGTLADTAPDLCRALNAVRKEEGLEAVPLVQTRPLTSQGVRGLLRVGFNITPEDKPYPALAQRVLEHYANALCVETALFPGMPEVLAALEQRGIKWGIVTNKHTRFTAPLVAALGLDIRAASVVCGDSAARPKPAPDPLILACTQAQVAPHRCAYVGDDLRDIQAGQAAGMHTVAVSWGYLGEALPIDQWGADTLIDTPSALLDLLDR